MTERPLIPPLAGFVLWLLLQAPVVRLWQSGGLTLDGALWVGVLSAIAVLLTYASALLRGLMFRVAVLFLPLSALVVVFILTVLLPEGGLRDERVLAALIGGTLVATGWLVTFFVTEYREARRFHLARRDTLYALQSEIYALVSKLDNQPIRRSADRVQGLILTGDGVDAWGRRVEYYPFATTESPPIVFEALSESIPSLRDDTVKRVLRFYAEYTDLRALVGDGRGQDVLRLAPERRKALHEQLTQRRMTTLRSGLKALMEINSDLGSETPNQIRRSGENPEIEV